MKELRDTSATFIDNLISAGLFPFREIPLLEPSEQQSVIHGLRDGNRSAWTALYHGYSADMWRHVARFVGHDVGSIADIVQEVFLAAARSARQFDPARGTLWGWLTGIAQHQIAAYWRQAGKKIRLQRMIEEGALEVSHLLDAARPVDQIGESAELADLVRVVLAQLPAEYAALLCAKYIAELSLEEMARQFSGGTQSVEAVKSKLARARREFRLKIEEYERLDREPSNA